MAAFVDALAPLPAQLMVNGMPFVSTFAGESWTYGQGNRSAGWQVALRNALPYPIYFAPFWSSLGADGLREPVVDGIGQWNAWPLGANNVSLLLGIDNLYISVARQLNKTYIAAVSPMFYAHFDGWNIITRSDNDLYGQRWQDLATLPDPPDMVEIVTWNDYGETTFIGPVSAAYDSRVTWLTGYDHSPWLDMTKFYTTWYKTGVKPKIAQDKFYAYHRSTPKATVAANDTIPAPLQWNVTDDQVYATAFLTPNTAVSYVSIQTGGSTSYFSAGPGINRFAMPFGMGAVSVAFLDQYKNTLVWAQSAMQVQNWTTLYNFNYNVFSASLPPSNASAPAPMSSTPQIYASTATVTVTIASPTIQTTTTVITTSPAPAATLAPSSSPAVAPAPAPSASSPSLAGAPIVSSSSSIRASSSSTSSSRSSSSSSSSRAGGGIIISLPKITLGLGGPKTTSTSITPSPLPSFTGKGGSGLIISVPPQHTTTSSSRKTTTTTSPTKTTSSRHTTSSSTHRKRANAAAVKTSSSSTRRSSAATTSAHHKRHGRRSSSGSCRHGGCSFI